MRVRLILIFGFMFAAPAAFGDISDSGNMTLGGNAIFQGTMTVQGSDANGYSLSVSSSISAQCINLQGGQVCGPGGSGNATLTSTQTFSGSNTFSYGGSTTTILSLSNLCVEVSSLDVVGVATATLSDPDFVNFSSFTYKAVYSVSLSSDALSFGLIVNTDVSAHYRGSVVSTYDGINPVNDCSLSNSSGTIASLAWFNTNIMKAKATTISGEALIRHPIHDNGNKTLSINGSNGIVDSTASGLTFTVLETAAWRWYGTSVPTSISFTGSANSCAGTNTSNVIFDGHFELWRCGYQIKSF